MASLQSIRRGQAPSVCDICETDTNIQYKCLDCLLLMCKVCCNKIHAKIKNSGRHKIVDIKDIENESEIDFTNINCENHSAFCCLFCKSCDHLVCPTCVAKDHKSHDLIEISEAYRQMLDEVEGIEKSSKERLGHLRSILRNLEQFKSLHMDKMAIEEKKMEGHRKALKNAVDNIDKLISDLKSSKEEVLTAVNMDFATIKQEVQITHAKHEGLIELMSTNDSSKFFNNMSKIKKSQDNDIPQTLSILISIPRFVSKDINHIDIGELQRDSDAESSCDQSKLEIIEQYKSELASVTDTCPCKDGSLWIYSNSDQTVQRVRPDKNKLKVISTINTKVYGMASTESGDLLISNGGTRLQQISCKSGQLSDTQYDQAPLSVTAIHIIQDGKVIVGGYDVNQDQAAVFVMDTDGRHERTYQHNNHGQPIFTHLICITSTRNGNIHVADCVPDNDRGRLVVLSQGGDLINIYNGHPEVNKVTPFYPSDVATTPGDNVLAVDLFTQNLHLLDNTGHLLTVYGTNDAGIDTPHSLAFTSLGSFWIGCSTTEDSTDKDARLYHVT